MSEHKKVPKRIAQTVLNSLKGGVVPRIGLPYIMVGRKNEVEALLHDVDIISEGGASFRFVVGKYGSGKSFLLQAIRNHVMDRGFIVADADLSPERRLQGTRGQGLATYRELISNLSTKTRPEGGALTLILMVLFPAALPYVMPLAGGAMIYTTVEEFPQMSSGEEGNKGALAFAVGFSLVMLLTLGTA